MSELQKYVLICILWTIAIAAIVYSAGWIAAIGVFIAFWANNLEQKAHKHIGRNQ